MTDEKVKEIAIQIENDMIYKYSGKLYDKVQGVTEWGNLQSRNLLVRDC